jgi:hypothetical protein
VFLTRLTTQAAHGVGQGFEAGAFNPATTGLAEAIGAILKLAQCPIHILQRGLEFPPKRHAHGLLKGICRIVSNMIAVSDTLVLRSRKPLQLLVQFSLFLQ